MPTNIEIKARAENIDLLKRRIENLYKIAPEEIFQVDTFFNIGKGRLKLRTFSKDKGELIYYERNNSAGLKRSDYFVYKTDNPDELKKLLEISLGIIGVVRKKRLVYIVGNTRIHLDEVENLGSFIELEVVLNPDQTTDGGKLIANDFMMKLNINENDLIDLAYIDLLEKQNLSK
jgi:predicted adenylyl cyclase CyaB